MYCCRILLIGTFIDASYKVVLFKVRLRLASMIVTLGTFQSGAVINSSLDCW